MHLLALNPALDRAALSDQFARDRRIQIRDVLERGSALELQAILARATPWGLAWNAGNDGPTAKRAEELAALSQSARGALGQSVAQTAAQGKYAFMYARYPILDAYKERWQPDGPHDILFEHINDAPFLDLVRTVTGVSDLVKADAQATLFAPGHFLMEHSDSHKGEGWRVAYVLSLAPDGWLPDWGGYLNFLDEDGDIVAGYRPRFNALNLFAVPAKHMVSYVPPFAPVGRFALTGWFRDR
ncbi:2OG-Fe(II) oxygenase [Sphingomonas baiyangensis]|uniref:Prolyl 3,4-dihydroxylase TPA1/OFD1 N-terminal domain-containing protein n=1 Tax=Sphingomonas baiyangensis TaxID=2572576 RepID=A0A4U1L4Z9_9SPHN|nr:2OG-Fe(II) oxygenase family protein [Sphingomonas baiyangensis]TKD51330.1 hypothetical protein FBR43_11630 [Sphingomonas baiyangensis]